MESRVTRILKPPVVLALLAAASSIPYVSTVGFYSDDWSFLAALRNLNHLDFASRYAALAQNTNLAVRPTQILQMLLLYATFGTDPLPYQLVTTAFLVAAAVLMYLALRQL